MKIGLLGTGTIARVLGNGWARAGHEVVLGSRRPAASVAGRSVVSLDEAVRTSEVVVFAVPHAAVREIVAAVGPSNFSGRTVVDVTNIYTSDFEWAYGFSTSGAEELQRAAPRARVVKAFNTVFAEHLESGKVGGEPATTFVAADDANAKATVLRLARDLGLDPIDAGELRRARYLEAAGLLLLHLAIKQRLGGGIGLQIRREAPRS